MIGEATLFDARATDPHTSHDAAASLPETVLRDQQRAVLMAVVRGDWNGWTGATAYEVVQRGYVRQQNVAAKRCSELRALGLIEDSGVTRPGSSNRELIVWRPTQAGEDVIYPPRMVDVPTGGRL